ncbi:hypothetical protein TW86_03835 [Halomonas sp. S2151]|uniref:hypothetical protein n=1 Tax=Halomonas sp. S2151 TaxID=579478 RepID=UPI0005FA735F|nr:hypothetical protein [Halomonas sp. S2151]KJZ17397.1 hypothetical protein TW86_03835 [Halomonas sp. S2151]
MTTCVIKDNVWTLANNVAFVEVSHNNVATVGYLMQENDKREASRERIATRAAFTDRVGALRYAVAFLAQCALLARDFHALEDYIHAQASMDSSDNRTA